MQNPEVLKVDVVLLGIRLLRTSEERTTFEANVGKEVQNVPSVGLEIAIGAPSQPPPSLPDPPITVQLPKDRITIRSEADRTTINRDFPEMRDIGLLCSTLSKAVESSDITKQQLQAYGFNFNVVYDLDPGQTAGSFITQQIFGRHLFADTKFDVVSGDSVLLLIREGKMWNIAIQPRLANVNSPKLFISMNLHIDQMQMPSEDEIANQMRLVWREACTLNKAFLEKV